jgi:hypothetical protein
VKRPAQHSHHPGLDRSILTLSLTLRNNALSTLPPHNRQHNRASSKKHTQRHTETPHSFGLEALGPATARPAREAHHRTALATRGQSHSERPGRFCRAGSRCAADGAAVEVADGSAEEDGDDGES